MNENDLVKLLHNPKLEKLWSNVGKWLCRYFRVKVNGNKNLPKSGKAIIIANHSGFAGLDVVVLGHIIRKATHRHPSILAHRAYFDISRLEQMISRSFNLRPASMSSGIESLTHDELLMIFPEGIQGNFKPSIRAYELQTFHTGFLRMALKTNAPVIPALVVGAEESNINLASINIDGFFKGYRLPLPLNIIPLPARWQITFLPPLNLKNFPANLADDPKGLEIAVNRIRKQMQRKLDDLRKKRPYIFFPGF